MKIRLVSRWSLCFGANMEADRETMAPGIVEGLEPFRNESGWWMEVASPKRGWFFCGSLISTKERVMANLARVEVK